MVRGTHCARHFGGVSNRLPQTWGFSRIWDHPGARVAALCARLRAGVLCAEEVVCNEYIVDGKRDEQHVSTAWLDGRRTATGGALPSDAATRVRARARAVDLYERA